MKCKIEGCNKEAVYKTYSVCQKHYFRFMRYGTYELTSKRKYRIENKRGYQKIYEPNHELSDSTGYVYEHRFIYHKVFKTVNNCSMCGVSINWKNCHIDHIDNDVTNNDILNLRATCRSCNVFRGHTPTSQGKYFIDICGVKMNVHAWGRQEFVEVSSATIRRRLKSGLSPYDSVFGERKTHTNTETKKTLCKTDDLRGITTYRLKLKENNELLG